jgi:hypothetical protein
MTLNNKALLRTLKDQNSALPSLPSAFTEPAENSAVT